MKMVRFWCRRILIGVSLLFVIVSAVGKSSKVVMSWKNPAYVRTKPFSRVLALGLSDKAKIRADFEDALAAQLADSGVETIPANTILLRPEGTHLDLQYLKTQVRENKLDAVVVSRLIKVDNTVTYIPGTAYVPPPLPYYGTFYGYYGAVYPMVYTPGYLKEEKKVRIETNLYVVSSGEGELVWTGITDTFNPTDVNKAIDRLVKLVIKQMRSDGAL
jgi:hypothetical protein